MKSIYVFDWYILDKKGMIQCCDSSVYDYQPCEIEIKIGNKKKKVIDLDGGAPQRFGKFADMIDRAYKPEKWIALKNTIHSQL